MERALEALEVTEDPADCRGVKQPDRWNVLVKICCVLRGVTHSDLGPQIMFLVHSVADRKSANSTRQIGIHLWNSLTS